MYKHSIGKSVAYTRNLMLNIPNYFTQHQ